MNAQNADVANNSVIEATNELSEAQASFTKLNDSMLEIAAAGEETQKIIKTISEKNRAVIDKIASSALQTPRVE